MNEPFLEFIAQIRAQQSAQRRGQPPGNTGTIRKARENEHSCSNYRPRRRLGTGDGRGRAESPPRHAVKIRRLELARGKEGTKVPEGRRLVAVGIAAAWVKWKGGKPVEYRMRVGRTPLPDRDELGDLDETQWGKARTKSRRKTAGRTRGSFIWSTRTAPRCSRSRRRAGAAAVLLATSPDRSTATATRSRGQLRVVELHAAPMQTKFGKKSKPHLKVVGWSGGERDVEQPKQIEHVDAEVIAETINPFDDEIDF